MVNGIKTPESVNKELYVKYMVCMRDKLLVKSELDQMGITYRLSVHGAIVFLGEITTVQQNMLKKRLLKSGLVLLDEEESKVIGRIINTIVEIIHYSVELPRIRFEDIISEHSEIARESVLKIFSDVKGMSVIQFIVTQKIERAKELLLYEERSLSDITDILNYKNQNYLVAQFKKYTGLTPDYFKKLKKERMKLSGSITSGREKATSS
jgi:AraC-like DNA-binding protein